MTIRLAAVVLAAGRSSRMGAANKLLLPFGDGCVLDAVLRAVTASGFAEIVVVTGAEADAVGGVARKHGARPVHNVRFAEGMGGSLAIGVAACAPADGYAVFLGDAPLVTPASIRLLITAFARRPADPTHPAGVVPTFNGRRGHPVLFAHALRRELGALTGDEGARGVLARHAAAVVEVPVDDDGILVDVDTPGAYSAALARLAAAPPPR